MRNQAFKLTAISMCAAMWATSAVAQNEDAAAQAAADAMQPATAQADGVGLNELSAEIAPATASPAEAGAETAAPIADASAPAAEADLADGASSRGVIEEIVVTARKREESIQSVPIAVSAVSGEALERANVTDVAALSTQVPNLVIIPSASGSGSIPTFAIRGQSQQEQSIISDPSVPVYFNEIAAQRPHGLNASLFDIQSVEVLKGPQGTLFGRNSTGGAVSIKANRPSNSFDGYAGVTVGSFNRMNTTAMINQPLADWAQLRVAGQTTDSDGWIDDVVTGKDVNTEHTKAMRVSLAVQPIDGLDSLFTYSRFMQDNGGTGAGIYRLNPGSMAMGNAGLGYVGQYSGQQMLDAQRARGIYDIASGADQHARVATWDLANTTTYELSDSLTLKNVMGTRRVDSDTLEDVDGMPIPLMAIHRQSEFKQFSEELQLMGSTDSTNWIVGLYYFNEKGGSDDYSLTAKSILTGPGSMTPQPSPTQFPGWSLTSPWGENTSQSVFAQVTQKLDPVLDGLSLTVGARYSWDERVARIRNRTGDATDPNGPQVCRVGFDHDNNPATPNTPYPINQCDFSFKKDFSEPTWNVSLDYQVTRDNLVYLANRRGYRTGGFGARATTVEALAETFKAETVTDFELGSKNTFFLGDMPLRLNVALFYADYTDIQRLLQIPGSNPVQTAPVNAGEATIKGGELEFTFMPTDRLEFSGFYSYTDAGYDVFVDPATGADLSGQPFARAPKNIYSLTTRYRLPVPMTIGDAAVQATYFHTDGYSPSDTYAPEQNVEGYGLLNLRADLRNAFGSSFDLGLTDHNALDKEYVLPLADLYSALPLGHIARAAGAPLTIGFDVRYRFGASGN